MSSTTSPGSVMRTGMLSWLSPSRAVCTRSAREPTSAPWKPSG